TSQQGPPPTQMVRVGGGVVAGAALFPPRVDVVDQGAPRPRPPRLVPGGVSGARPCAPGPRTRQPLGLGPRSPRSSDSPLANLARGGTPPAAAPPWRSWRSWRSFITPR